ncbi:putative membrane protein [Bradyrhizobium japonicum]
MLVEQPSTLRNFDPERRLIATIHLPEETFMKKAALAFALLAVFASPSSAQSVGEKTGVNSALGIAPKTEDFIKEAAMSDMTEIEAAKIAQQKGNADEKRFAEMMVTDHTKTSSELKSMVPDNLKATIPASLDDASQKKIAKLRDAKPEDFASEYDPMQVSAHKDAVSLFDRYANGGDDAKLKDWAGKTLPALKHHLEMAQALDRNRK